MGAWDENATHPALTEEAIRRAQVFEDALTFQLSFESKIGEKLRNGQKSYTIVEWLTRGSAKEDKPVCRAANHFHNPWKEWENDPPRNGGSSHHA